MFKYDIPTLLALRQNARAETEKYRIHALGNSKPRQRKANLSALSQRSANRSRETSNRSYHSEAASSTSVPSLRLPTRQPKNPPRGALSQSDVGFARFLKEHSSPKHQRVTAGGRIVPMDVSTPAPKMKLPVKDQDTKEHDRPATLPRGRNDKRQRRSISGVEKNTAATDISQASSIPGGVLLDQLKIMPGNGILGQYAQVPGLFPNLSSISGNPAMFIRPNVSFPLGSHLSQSEQQEFCFGGDQVWLSNPSRPSDSQNTTPPNQSHQSRSGSSESSGRNNFVPMGIPFNAMSSGLDSFYPAFGTAGYPLVPTQGSVLNLSFPPQISSDGAMDPPTVPGASKQYETLTAQLARLDRYMAVHTWDLDYRSKKLLVEERMNLVRDLDAIRLYKEQLETTFGPVKIGSGETESETNTHGPRGQLSQNQSVHIPRFSASAASNAPALFGPPAVLPVDDPFSSDVQCQGKGDVYSCEDNTGFGGMATGGPSGGWSYQEADTTGPGKQNAHCKTGNSTEFDSQGGLDAWTAPTKSAPPDIGRIYQRIEEATRNGAPIGGLLQELAEVTTRFVQQVTEEQKASRNLEARWDSRTNVTTARPSTTVSKGAYPVPRPTHTTGRQWKSEECAPTSVNDLGSAPDEVDEEGEEESCTSSCSTTDSWATIQGESQCGTMEVISKNEKCEENRNWPQNQEQQALADARPVMAPASNIRNTVDLAAKGDIGAESRRSGSGSTKNSGSQRLTQYFDKAPGMNSRKSAALAISQSINAHAFLPTFDGAADADEASRFMEGDQANGQSQNPAVLGWTQVPGFWYSQREQTNPAALRDMYRLIEEGARVMQGGQMVDRGYGGIDDRYVQYD